MKFPEIVFLLVLLLATSPPSLAQTAEPSLNTFKIKKPHQTIEQAASRIFQLYCKEALDSLMMEYFPNQETAIEIAKQRAILNGEWDLSIRSKYEGGRDLEIRGMRRNIEYAKKQNIPLRQLTIDSITVKHLNGDTMKESLSGDLPFVMLHCSASNQSYQFGIFPLLEYLEDWYILGAEMDFTKAKSIDELLNEDKNRR